MFFQECRDFFIELLRWNLEYLGIYNKKGHFRMSFEATLFIGRKLKKA